MYVIYHSSDSFASVTGISMVSLFENNKGMDHIHILYIEKGMTEENKAILLEIAQQYGRELEFMQMPDWSEKLNVELKTCKAGWLGFGYNRLFLTEYIPPSVDRVLYLDSDTIIEAPLDELWNTEMDDCYLAGVDDCLSSEYRDIVGLDDNGTYCNAGMLLINLKKWREERITGKFIDVINENNGYFVFNEQSILNSVFSGKIKILPQKYNVNSLVYLFDYDELMKLRRPHNFSYDEQEFYEARNNPAITHFTGNFLVARRPWVVDSDHPHKDAFLHYRALSPWRDAALQEDVSKKSSKMYTSVCKKLPRSVMISSVSFLYNKVRTKVFRRKLAEAKA